MKRGHGKPRKGRKSRPLNPRANRFLTDDQLEQVIGDSLIGHMFGTFGTALSFTSPKLREWMLKAATGSLEVTDQPGSLKSGPATKATSQTKKEP